MRAAALVRREIDRALQERGAAHLGLSGGTTPARTYELLGADAGTWSGVQIWFADERCVPPDDDESNYRLANETLLAPAGIEAAGVHRMQGELGPETGRGRLRTRARRAPAGGDGDADGVRCST